MIHRDAIRLLAVVEVGGLGIGQDMALPADKKASSQKKLGSSLTVSFLKPGFYPDNGALIFIEYFDQAALETKKIAFLLSKCALGPA